MMKQNHKTAVRRTLSICMALLLAGGSVSPVLAAEGRTPACDETYYATLDYYGALLESSVVKTYHTLGQHTLTDYGSYDSVTLSKPSQNNRFHMDLVSRLSQEVRTSTTTGDIAKLRQQVASGQYTPDPMSIAARMLFLGEGR